MYFNERVHIVKYEYLIYSINPLNMTFDTTYKVLSIRQAFPGNQSCLTAHCTAMTNSFDAQAQIYVYECTSICSVYTFLQDSVRMSVCTYICRWVSSRII